MIDLIMYSIIMYYITVYSMFVSIYDLFNKVLKGSIVFVVKGTGADITL